MAMTTHATPPEQPDEVPVKITDKRRIDPETGQLRQQPAATADPASDPPNLGVKADAGAPEGLSPPEPQQAQLDQAQAEVSDLTEQLQRLAAEYQNYRKRVEREKTELSGLVTAAVLAELLPVLDDIHRAEQHGDLTGPFQAIAAALTETVKRLGLVGFGTVGDEFDPTIHEALSQVPAEDAESGTIVEVFREGYQHGDRIVRPAQVVVAQ